MAFINHRCPNPSTPPVFIKFMIPTGVVVQYFMSNNTIVEKIYSGTYNFTNLLKNHLPQCETSLCPYKYPLKTRNT